jgi:hypothetical protein
MFQSFSVSPILSLKLAFAVAFAVSFSVSCCAAPPSPRAVAADLLAVLAGPGAAARVPPAAESARLRACLRFLSPVLPLPAAAAISEGRAARKVLVERGGADEADGMVMWPPAPVMELARLAVDSGGDPGAIHRALDPTMLPVSSRLSRSS